MTLCLLTLIAILRVICSAQAYNWADGSGRATPIRSQSTRIKLSSSRSRSTFTKAPYTAYSRSFGELHLSVLSFTRHTVQKKAF